MPALVQGLGDFLKVLIQAFNLSSIFPALVFVILSWLYLLPLLPETSPLHVALIQDVPVRGWLLIILTALMAYLLDAVNFQLIRFFEGYGIIRGQFPFVKLEEHNRKRVKEIVDDLRKLDKVFYELLDEIQIASDENHVEDLYKLADELVSHGTYLEKKIAHQYPEEPEFVLPFRLGNIIAAAERYPYKVFGMETVVLWPFLVPILTKRSYAQFVVREKAMLDFLINLVVAVASFGMFLGLTQWWVEGWSLELAKSLVLVAAVCWITLLLSLQAAANWGATIRTAFVIFREDLRQMLRLRRPRSYDDERKIWENASNFFQARGFLDRQLDWGHEIFDQTSYAQPISLVKEDKS